MHTIRRISTLGLLLISCTTSAAAVHRFDADPFAGTTALTTPGRQIVGGESSISFDVAHDVFSLASSAFESIGPVSFFNGAAVDIPASGINTVVLQTFDSDNNPATPFGAGIAANLIADQVTAPGAGFFVYFNQGLDLPRLVYSTDLGDATADLKILFRLTNLSGQAGRDAMVLLTTTNFQIAAVPEPSSAVLMGMAGVLLLARIRRRATLPT